MTVTRIAPYRVFWLILLTAVLAFGAVILLRALALGFTLARPILYWDNWEFVKTLPQVFDHSFSLQQLFAQHNEHRIATPRIVFIIDFLWFGGAGYFSIVLEYLSFMSIAWMLSRIATPQPHLRLCIFVVSFGFILSPAQWENLSSGFQIAFPFVDVFLIVSMACLIRAIDAQDRRRQVTCLMAATAFDALAVFSLASGVLAIVPALAIGLFLNPRSKPWIIYLGLHLILCACFFYGYRRQLDIVPTYDLILMTHYAVLYLGACLRSYEYAPLLLGLVDVVLIAYALIRLALVARRDRVLLDRVQVLALSIILLLVAGAYLTANGRASLGIATALSSRYSLQSIVIQICLFVYFWRVLDTPRLQSGPLNAKSAALLLSLFMVSAASNLSAQSLEEWQDRISSFDTAGSAMANGVFSEDMLKLIYPVPAVIEKPIQLLASRRLSLFSPRFAQTFRPPGNAIVGWQPDTTADCVAMFGASRVGPTWMQLNGWIYDQANPAGNGWILVLDRSDHDRIVGFGRQSIMRRDVDAVMKVDIGRSGFQVGLNSPTLRGDTPRAFTVLLVPQDERHPICKTTLPTGEGG